MLGVMSKLKRYIPGLSHQELIVEINKRAKFIVRNNTSDQLIIFEVWKLHEYDERPGFKINSSDTVVVIGAQIGVFSVLAAQKTKNGRVISYEPFDKNYGQLIKNIKLNKIKNIKPVKLAVGDKMGKVQLFVDKFNTGGHSMYLTKNRHPETIDIIKLESIFRTHKLKTIDFLKIDVEGAEYDILLNVPNKILKRIKKIVIEYHDRIKPGYDHGMIVNKLKSAGFEVETFAYLLQSELLKTGFIYAKLRDRRDSNP